MKNMEQNNLGLENSPYLRQHSSNPVWWQPYGHEAIQQAEKSNRLLVVSIGYSACHWCHVMEHESFSDQEVAAVMNSRYVSIKLDREERPDLDHVYMQAAMLSSRQGGWPLNALCLPDGRPFFAGTYFPKERWLLILNHFYGLWITEPQSLLEAASQIQQGISRLLAAPTIDFDATPDISGQLQDWKQRVYAQLDPDFGGPDREPRFPMPAIALPFLSDNQPMAERIKTWLLRMAAGGIYDQVGGGFARYSTDGHWFVPHFEKMLYDNAQLLEVYALAFQREKHPIFLRTLHGILDWVSSDLELSDGRIQSAMDADSEGEEGLFYCWKPEELPAFKPEEWNDLRLDFEWIPEGNWEGKTIFWRPKRWAQPLLPNTESALQKLKRTRDLRTAPSIDTKVLLGWNALYLKGLVAAALCDVCFEEKILKKAGILGEVLWKYRNEQGQWTRCIEARPYLPAFLEDLAPLGLALTGLHQLYGKGPWLDRALQLAEDMVAQFGQADSPLLSFSAEPDPITGKAHFEIQDNVIPSGNSMAARFFWELGRLSGRMELIERAKKMLFQAYGALNESPMWHSGWLLLAETIADPPDELRYHEDAISARRVWRQRHRAPLLIFDESLAPGHWQVCRGTQCILPAASEAELLNCWPNYVE